MLEQGAKRFEQVGELGYVIVKMDIQDAEYLGLVYLLFTTVFTTLLRTSGI